MRAFGWAVTFTAGMLAGAAITLGGIGVAIFTALVDADEGDW